MLLPTCLVRFLLFVMPRTCGAAIRYLSADCVRIQVLLARYSAQDDIVVGTPYANRSMPELKQLAGCMVNTLALRTAVSGKTSFRQLLKAASRAAREAYAHAEAPFAMVVDALKQPRSASFTPVYQVDSDCHTLVTNALYELYLLSFGTVQRARRSATYGCAGAADLGGRVRLRS